MSDLTPAQIRELQWLKDALEARCLELGAALDAVSAELASVRGEITALKGGPQAA